jgi:DUF2993 family protein
VIVVAIVAALLAVVLVADRVAVIRAQDRVGRQIADRGSSAKPHVNIAGFPFLTQVAVRRLNKVVIRAEGAKLGPVEVKCLDLTLHRIRAGSGGRTASRLSGAALVGFAALATMTGTPGLTLSAGGPDRVKITAGLGPVTGTATARVTWAGPGGIRIAVISVAGIPVAVPGPLRDITVPLPALPPGMTIPGRQRHRPGPAGAHRRPGRHSRRPARQRPPPVTIWCQCAARTCMPGWNWQNWMRGSEQYGTARDPEINAALSEGWGWLTASLCATRPSPRRMLTE